MEFNLLVNKNIKINHASQEVKLELAKTMFDADLELEFITRFTGLPWMDTVWTLKQSLKS
jgi:hypothetical protein